MKNIREKIQQDIRAALKEKKELEVLVLRQLSAAVLNKEKEKRFKLNEEEIELTDEEIMEAVISEAKKRKEAIPEYEKGGREELAEKERKELEILQRYLPGQLSEEEVRKLVQAAVNKVGAKEIKDMGKVMAELMPKVKGEADGNLVSKIVKELLKP